MVRMWRARSRCSRAERLDSRCGTQGWLATAFAAVLLSGHCIATRKSVAWGVGSAEVPTPLITKHPSPTCKGTHRKSRCHAHSYMHGGQLRAWPRGLQTASLLMSLLTWPVRSCRLQPDRGALTCHVAVLHLTMSCQGGVISATEVRDMQRARYGRNV